MTAREFIHVDLRQGCGRIRGVMALSYAVAVHPHRRCAAIALVRWNRLLVLGMLVMLGALLAPPTFLIGGSGTSGATVHEVRALRVHLVLLAGRTLSAGVSTSGYVVINNTAKAPISVTQGCGGKPDVAVVLSSPKVPQEAVFAAVKCPDVELTPGATPLPNRHGQGVTCITPTAGQSGTTGYREPVDLPELLVADTAEWRTWLRGHHSKSQGVWLVLAKKGTTHPTMLSYDEALDEAICFGWIDGQLGRRDNATFLRRFTPRKARSPWSQRNVAIAERLSASGRMDRSGEDEVRQAKADGRWNTAYAGQASVEVPEDLADALIANPGAQARFQTLTSANRYSILYRIGSAKKVETRARRIEQFVEMLARGETIHPQGPRSPR